MQNATTESENGRETPDRKQEDEYQPLGLGDKGDIMRTGLYNV
jgi:hypothetical protein